MNSFAKKLKQVRSIILLLLSIVWLPATAADFITDVMLIGAGNKQDLNNLKSQYQAQGWNILDKDFNAGIDWGKGDGILLLYKTATNTDGYNNGYITDLYLQNRSAANTTSTLDFNGRVYNLVPFDGSQHFIDVKGDLNSGTGASTDAIHLYYTKEHFADNRAITDIYINNSSSDAIGREGTHSGYNLNAGCSSGENIFLHASTATAPFKYCYFTDVMLIGAESSSELNTIKDTYTSQGWKVIDYDLNKGIDWGKAEAVYLLYKAEISPNGMNHNYITDFYLQNRSAANTNDTLVFNGHTYQIVPYEGSQHFKNVKGDLNSGTGQDTDPIHLYYTRQCDKTGATINGIFFNNHPQDSITVWKEGDKYPYDLNSGCSALTQEKIYMHYTIGTPSKGVSPKGELIGCKLQGRIINVNGWAYDPDVPSDTIVIKATLSFHNPNFELDYYGGTELLDEVLNASQGITGTHGFNINCAIPQSCDMDTIDVKVYAYDRTGNDPIQLGTTHTFSITNTMPKSSLEGFQAQARGFSIKGWAYDPDYPEDPTKIRVVIKSNANNNIYKTLYFDTDQERTDINGTEGIEGNHGFSTFISIPDAPAGTYTVLIYALDNAEDDGTPTGDPQTITITRTQPIYGLEIFEVNDDKLLVQGWAYDPDDSNKSIAVRLEIKNEDGSVYKTWNLGSTNVMRDDINDLYNIKGTHGFRNVVYTDKVGTFYVNIYACDITGDKDIQMGNTQTAVFTSKKNYNNTYNLWVGSTKVTYSNKDNILNQLGKDHKPTAVFNPETNTLILNDPVIDGEHESYRIFTDNINLTIKGKYHETDHFLVNGVFCTGGYNDLTLDGDFILSSKEMCIKAKHIYIKSGSVIFKSKYFGIANCTCTVSGKVSYVEMTGYSKIDLAIFATGHNITTPTQAIVKNGKIFESDGVTLAKHVILEPKNEPYKVWIGNKQVTSNNCDDIFENGKASFNLEKNTLTLNNPYVTGYHTFDDNRTAVIYSEVGDLTLNGTFKQAEPIAQYCIATAGGNLSITGDFDLPGTIAGVSCNTLKVQNGTTNLTLTGGTTASESTDIVLENWLNPLSPDRVIINGKFYESDGSTLAKQVALSGYATDPFYNLWLGNTQVSISNKENILNQTGVNGEPTASFDPSTATLTLNNPNISGTHNSATIYSNIKSLTVKGDYHMTTAGGFYGFKSESNYNEPTEFDGNFTFLGTRYGIYAFHNISVNSGTFKAIGASNAGVYVQNMYVQADVRHIETEGGEYAICIIKGSLKCEGTLGLSVPINSIVEKTPDRLFTTIYETDGNTIAKKAIIEPGHKTYHLWVGSTFVTPSNCMDILGDGKASFNPANNTLTLNEPIINDFHYNEDNSTATIIAKGMDLTIKGKYNMSQANADFGVLVSDGSLTLDGDFTFYGKICGASSSNYYSNRGAYTNANLGTTLIGNIKLIGQEYGLNSYGETTLNGTIHISGEKKGLFSNLSIYVDEGTLATIEATTYISIESYNNEDKNTKMIINGGVKGLVVNNGVQLNDLIILNGEGQNAQIINYKNARFDPLSHTVLLNDAKVDRIVIGSNYNLFVGGNQVTSLNCDDILGDGGKVRFDPNTNTLIMDSPEIDYYLTDKNGITAKIYASDMDLNVKGMYHMKDTTDFGLLLQKGNITLDGSFTFNAQNVALDCSEGTLTIKSNEANNIKLNGGKGYKTLMAVDLVLEDGMIVEKPQKYEFSHSRMTIIDKVGTENKVAHTIVISHKSTPYEPDPTTIQGIKSRNYYPETDSWYDMYGRKLTEMPTVKGLYIYNGRTVLIE